MYLVCYISHILLNIWPCFHLNLLISCWKLFWTFLCHLPPRIELTFLGSPRILVLFLVFFLFSLFGWNVFSGYFFKKLYKDNLLRDFLSCLGCRIADTNSEVKRFHFHLGCRIWKPVTSTLTRRQSWTYYEIILIPESIRKLRFQGDQIAYNLRKDKLSEEKHEKWLIYNRAWAEDGVTTVPLQWIWASSVPGFDRQNVVSVKLCLFLCSDLEKLATSSFSVLKNFLLAFLAATQRIKPDCPLDLQSGQATCGPWSTALLRTTSSHPY